ncbi:MAG: cytochrome c oxidase subunit 3 [Planctomycetota bacterium]|nr:cytochrome c oxidase subunit 3 [Planctomycetota bacterium]MDA1113957.1 cytochrome c oxidase subunit 3 [Planctomycetota bacterium]
MSSSGKFRQLPGDAAWWVFLSAEFATLSIFFVAFAWSKTADPEVFAQGQRLLHPDVGFANTLVLITSGFFAARGVLALHQQRHTSCARWYAAAAALGVVFLGIKTWEYAEKLGDGINLSTSNFFFFYFFLTGFHYLHVMLGVGFLSVMAWKVRRKPVEESTVMNFESSAAFWHMLDLVWVILFPLLYLA